jgi:hypothetical protein
MTRTIPHRLGLYLAVVQFFFALTWTVYVIYLPKLAAQVGISGKQVLLLLVLDQLIFTIMDFSMGVMADRVARVVGRLSYVILGVTLASCLAFLLLPFVAPQGSAVLFLTLTILWTASSSVLRAPPLALLGKHAARPAVPWLSALTLFGLGVAGAVSPYLTVALREADPRLPFVLSTIALAAATLGIVWMERALADTGVAPAPAANAGPPKPIQPVFGFLFAVVLLGLGFQVHFALNSAPLYLRHAPASDLAHLMPVFWVGFNLLLLPASFATRRWGGLAVMGLGGITGAIATLLALKAGNLTLLVALQFIAGSAWGCVLMSAVAAALAIGHTGREGKITGAVFALLALATMARIAAVATGVGKDPSFVAILGWTPTALWLLAGSLLLLILPAQRKLIAP